MNAGCPGERENAGFFTTKCQKEVWNCERPIKAFKAFLPLCPPTGVAEVRPWGVLPPPHHGRVVVSGGDRQTVLTFLVRHVLQNQPGAYHLRTAPNGAIFEARAMRALGRGWQGRWGEPPLLCDVTRTQEPPGLATQLPPPEESQMVTSAGTKLRTVGGPFSLSPSHFELQGTSSLLLCFLLDRQVSGWGWWKTVISQWCAIFGKG